MPARPGSIGSARALLPRTAERPLHELSEPPDQFRAPRLHSARYPVREQHLVRHGEHAGEVARVLLHEHALGDTAPEDLGLELVDLAPLLDLLIGARRGAHRPRRARAEMHAQKGGMGDEVVDVDLDQRPQRLAGRQAAGGDRARQAEQLLAAHLEDGAMEVVLAREDGVDRAHRQPRKLRDLLDFRRLEAALGEDPLGCLEDMLPVDAGARLARLVAGGPSHGGLIPLEKPVDKSNFRMVVRAYESVIEGAAVRGEGGSRWSSGSSRTCTCRRGTASTPATCASWRPRSRSTRRASSTTGRPSTTSSPTTRTSRRPRSSSPGSRRAPSGSTSASRS